MSEKTGFLLGGLLRFFMEKRASTETGKNDRREKGILFGSGLVGGEGLFGVGIAAMVFIQGEKTAGIGYDWAGSFAPLLAIVAFGGLVYFFARRCLSK